MLQPTAPYITTDEYPHHGLPWKASGDHERLLALAPTHTREQIAKLLGRTYDSVKARCLRLGLQPAEEGRGVNRGRLVRPWSPEDDYFLREWSERRPIWWIAEKLGRTRRATERHGYVIGIHFRNTEGWSLSAVAKWLGYGREDVHQAAEALGQVWRRKVGTNHCVITDEQRAELERYFVEKIWAA